MVYTSPVNFDAGKAGYETIRKIGLIHARTLTRLSELQVDMATLGVETTLEQTSLLADIGNYPDLVTLESDLARKYCDRITEVSRQTTDILLETGDDLRMMIEDIIYQSPVKKDVTKAEVETNPEDNVTSIKDSKPRAGGKKKTAIRKAVKAKSDELKNL